MVGRWSLFSLLWHLLGHRPREIESGCAAKGVTEPWWRPARRGHLGESPTSPRGVSIPALQSPQEKAWISCNRQNKYQELFNLILNFTWPHFRNFKLNTCQVFLYSNLKRVIWLLYLDSRNIGADAGESAIRRLNHQEPGIYPKSEEGRLRFFTAFPSQVWKIEKTKLITASLSPLCTPCAGC